MESEWKLNVVRAGHDYQRFYLAPFQTQPAFRKWAILTTPLVILGVTYRSIIQHVGIFGVVGWLSRADLTSYDPGPLDRYWSNVGPFPYGLDVLPDS